MTELKESYNCLLSGLHPCIILSNFRCLENSPLIQIVPISTKPKSQPFHIEIEGYGLDYKSIILIEQIQTVGREALKYRIGKVTPDILLEINKKSDMQLGFDNNYSIEMFEKVHDMLDEIEEFNRYLKEDNSKDILEDRQLLIRDLNNFCMNYCIQFDTNKYINRVRLKPLKEYEPLRREIKNYLIKEKNYNKSIELCFEYLNQIKDFQNVDADLDFIYYEIALNYQKLGDTDNVLKYILLSLEHCDKTTTKYVKRLWLQAECYVNLNMEEEAKELYYLCSKLFRDAGEQKQRVLVMFNNAKLMKNYKAMINIIKLYESRCLRTKMPTFGDLDYKGTLLNLYTELFEVYIEVDRNKVLELINGIKDTNLRVELNNKFNS